MGHLESDAVLVIRIPFFVDLDTDNWPIELGINHPTFENDLDSRKFHM